MWETLEIPRVVLGEKCGTVVIGGDGGWEKERGILRSLVDTITLESSLAMGEAANEPALPLSSSVSQNAL